MSHRLLSSILWWALACGRDRDRSLDDSGPLNEIPGDVTAVTETSSGRLLLLEPGTGVSQGEVCLYEVLPDLCVADPEDGEQCLLFSAEHQRQESGESAFLLTYSRRDPDATYSPGGAALVTATHPPVVRWSVEQLSFTDAGPDPEATICAAPDATDARCFLNGTHIVVGDPEGDTLWVADTNNSRALWLDAPASDGTATVLMVMDARLEGWAEGRSLNHLQRLTVEGRPMLLTTFKSAVSDTGALSDTGRLVLWDLSVPTAPARVWAWPDPDEEGFLAAVHHGMVVDTAQGPLLVYAHSLGASDDPDEGLYGSVGLARFNGTTPPTYLADGLLPEAEYPLGFVREVDVPPPGDWLLITDSGCENADAVCSFVGRVLAAHLPTLDPEGQSGALGDQRFITLDLLEDVRRPQITFPYEADALYQDDLDTRLAEGSGPCTGDGSR